MTVSAGWRRRRRRHAPLPPHPVFEVLLYVVSIGACLFIVFWIGFFLLHVLRSVLGYLSGSGDEFGEIIVFWGGVGIVVALIVLVFTQHIVAFE
jgi:hypothetical protein